MPEDIQRLRLKINFENKLKVFLKSNQYPLSQADPLKSSSATIHSKGLYD